MLNYILVGCLSKLITMQTKRLIKINEKPVPNRVVYHAQIKPQTHFSLRKYEKGLHCQQH